MEHNNSNENSPARKSHSSPSLFRKSQNRDANEKGANTKIKKKSLTSVHSQITSHVTQTFGMSALLLLPNMTAGDNADGANIIDHQKEEIFDILELESEPVNISPDLGASPITVDSVRSLSSDSSLSEHPSNEEESLLDSIVSQSQPPMEAHSSVSLESGGSICFTESDPLVTSSSEDSLFTSTFDPQSPAPELPPRSRSSSLSSQPRSRHNTLPEITFSSSGHHHEHIIQSHLQATYTLDTEEYHSDNELLCSSSRSSFKTSLSYTENLHAAVSESDFKTEYERHERDNEVITPTEHDACSVKDTTNEKSFKRRNATRRKQQQLRESRSMSLVIYNAYEPYESPKISKIPLDPLTARAQLPSHHHHQHKQVKPSVSAEITIRKFKLHYPRSAEKLRKYLKSKRYDEVQRDRNQDTPLHAIVRSNRRDKFELLLVMMVHSDFGTENIDLPNTLYNNTALHLAVQCGDVEAARLLLCFGADINATNKYHKTPLDVLPQNENREQLYQLLLSLDAKYGNSTSTEPLPVSPTRMGTGHHPTYNPQSLLEDRMKNSSPDSILDPISVHDADRLEANMNELYQSLEDQSDDMDLQFALGIQQFELQKWKATSLNPLHFQAQGGSRILFLDGGGIRGLVQIEILLMLEKKTGRKITELFDWIVGTSTGGIVALGLVYANKSLAELRQVYFKMKEEIFSGFSRDNTKALEDLLKETMGENMRMSDVDQPKVLVAAVYKKTTRPVIHFFNNCFNNEYSNEYIWKVARYTSAAPMYFSELDNYVDGGILCNNPSDAGLTAIQNYHRLHGKKLDIAFIVSIGSGIYPEEELGSTDAHEMLQGINVLNLSALKRRATNLLTLLSNALVDSETVAKNCKSRCEEQHIPFYRFSPNLQFLVSSGETDDNKLVEMLLQTKIQAAIEWEEQFDELMKLFHSVADFMKEQLQKLRKARKDKKEKMAIAASHI